MYSGVHLERRLHSEGVVVLFPGGDALLEEYYTAGILLRWGKHLLEQERVSPMRSTEQFLRDNGLSPTSGDGLFLLRPSDRDRAILYLGSSRRVCQLLCAETDWVEGSPLRMLADSCDVWWEFQQVQTPPYSVSLRFGPDAELSRCQKFDDQMARYVGLPLAVAHR